MSATLSRQEFDVSSAGYQHCTRKRAYFQDDEEQLHNAYKRVKASASYPLSLSSIIYDDLQQKPVAPRSKEPWEDDTESKPRLIDLSTGEILEPIPSTKQKDQQKLERFPEVGENGEEDSVLHEYIQDVNGSSLHGGGFAVGCDRNIRNSDKSILNYIEENLESVVDTQSTTKVVQSPQNLSAVLKGTRFKFTDQYQQAFDKYMRSQIDHVNDGACGVYGKEVILYRLRQDEYNISGNSPRIREINDTSDVAEGKIVEITEDDIEMYDVVPDANEAVMEIESPCDEVDKMDID